MDFRVAHVIREAAPSRLSAGEVTTATRFRAWLMSIWIRANGGVIRNLGDTGLAIQAVAPLYVNQQVFLRFDLAIRGRASKPRAGWPGPIPWDRRGSSLCFCPRVPGAC